MMVLKVREAMKKILLYRWNALNEEALYENLIKLGLDVTVFDEKCEDYMFDGELSRKMIFFINENHIDTVISFNFLPVISLICEACGTDYYSWGYDSPMLSVYAKCSPVVTNKIALFDRREVEFLNAIGLENVYHVPLAVDTDKYDERLKRGINRGSRLFSGKMPDVSFVGSMYTDERKNNLYDVFHEKAAKKGEDSTAWSQLDGLIESCAFNYETGLIDYDLSDVYDFLKPYMLEAKMGFGDNYFDVEEIIMREGVLEKKVTQFERLKLMTAIADAGKLKGFDFGLFTTSKTTGLGNLDGCNRGPVDYKDEMPFVFNQSKINLHITLRSIHTGIPLRVFDVLGCGGFLLTNAQEEILESFGDGVHLAVYKTPEECIDKISYYLSHEEERQKIALEGKKRVKELFSYEKGIKKLLKL